MLTVFYISIVMISWESPHVMKCKSNFVKKIFTYKNIDQVICSTQKGTCRWNMMWLFSLLHAAATGRFVSCVGTLLSVSTKLRLCFPRWISSIVCQCSLLEVKTWPTIDQFVHLIFQNNQNLNSSCNLSTLSWGQLMRIMKWSLVLCTA